MGLLAWEAFYTCIRVNATANVLKKHSTKHQLKHANLARLNVKIVSVQQQIAHNVNFKADIKHFY